MHKSEYFQEEKIEMKDSLTSGVLTFGIIATIIVILIQFSICASTAFPL
jgi:hypothetical protein